MAEVLGLTYSQAEYVFDPIRTIKDLKDLPNYVMNTDGYSEDGFDHLDYDKNGFNKYGYDEDGCDQHGYHYGELNINKETK